MPHALKHGVLTTGWPEESQCLCFDLTFNLKWPPGDFLSDQWLRPHGSNAVGVVLICDLGTKVPHDHGAAPSKKLGCSPGCPAPVPKSPSPFSEPPFCFEYTSLSFYGSFHPWIIIDSMLATSLWLWTLLSRDHVLFVFHPQYLALCLAHNRSSINVYWQELPHRLPLWLSQ